MYTNKDNNLIDELKPLVGKSPHHINSTQDFLKQIENETLSQLL